MHKKCEAIGCAKQPTFGFPGERARRCTVHRLDRMVRALPQGTDMDVHLLTGTC